MTEREMKEIIGSFLKKAVVPAALGFGLALSAANCGEAEDQSAANEDELLMEGKLDQSDVLQLSSMKYASQFCTSVDDNKTHGFIFKLNAKCYHKSTDTQAGFWGTWQEVDLVSAKYMAQYPSCQCLGPVVAKYMAPLEAGVGTTHKYDGSFPAKVDTGLTMKYAANFPKVI